jgi:hypothetical protein
MWQFVINGACLTSCVTLKFMSLATCLTSNFFASNSGGGGEEVHGQCANFFRKNMFNEFFSSFELFHLWVTFVMLVFIEV